MVIVSVNLEVKEQYQQTCIAEFARLSQTVREETGCIEYQMYKHPEKEDALFIFEKWETKEVLDAHLETKHMKDYFKLSEKWFENKNLEIYEVK